MKAISKLRKISIDAVLSDSSVCSLGDDIYEKYLEVQQPFFDFIQKFEGELSYPQKPQIFYRLTIPTNDGILIFNLF